MPPIKIDTPQGPIYIDPVTGDIVAAPTESGAAAPANTSSGIRIGGGPSGASALGNAPGTGNDMGSGIPTTPGSVGGNPAGPAPHVVNVTNLGGGLMQYQYSDGTFETVDTTRSGSSGVSTANARINAETAANQLAQNNEQFYQNMGFEKAKYDTTFNENKRQFDAAQAQARGNTLLGLGSRPDTLVKYLYALQGQQTPQGIQNTTQNLPGYSNVLGTPGLEARPAAATTATAAPAITPPANLPVAPGGTNITATDPRLGPNPPLATPPLRAGVAPTATQGATNAQLGAQDALIAGGRTPKFYSNGVAIFKHGGPIPEHVIGIGLKSGKTYEFGEKGPEFVIPNNKVKDLMSLLGKGMMDKSGEQDMMGNKSYATGGSINYDPTNVPAIGSQSSGFFNDPNLRNVVSRGYNSNPGVPLFPQVSLATGGGSSLVPSSQRLNALLPSEQSLYAGTLQDEFGANPEDVYAMARKLAPNVAGLRTPRYAA